MDTSPEPRSAALGYSRRENKGESWLVCLANNSGLYFHLRCYFNNKINWFTWEGSGFQPIM